MARLWVMSCRGFYNFPLPQNSQRNGVNTLRTPSMIQINTHSPPVTRVRNAWRMWLTRCLENGLDWPHVLHWRHIVVLLICFYL